jgi:hypothetical protein
MMRFAFMSNKTLPQKFFIFFRACYSWDVYWDEPKGAFVESLPAPEDAKDRILSNFVQAATLAGVKHIICVVTEDCTKTTELVASSGIPYTIIYSPVGVVDTPDYTYQKGVQGDLVITHFESEVDENSRVGVPVCREDLSAVCVQCLQTLNWNESRRISIASRGPIDKSLLLPDGRSKKRVDQQWCVNSFVLEDKLANIQ